MDVKILAGGALLAGFIIYNNKKKNVPAVAPTIIPSATPSFSENKERKLHFPLTTPAPSSFSQSEKEKRNIENNRFKTYDLSKLGRSEQKEIFTGHISKKALEVRKIAGITIGVVGATVSLAAILGYIINSINNDGNRTPPGSVVSNKELGEKLLDKGIEDVNKINTNVRKEDIDEIIELDNDEKDEIAEKLEDNAKTLKENVLDALKQMREKFTRGFEKIKGNVTSYWFSEKDVKINVNEGFEMDEESNLKISSTTGGFITEINQLKIDISKLKQDVEDNALAIKTNKQEMTEEIKEIEASIIEETSEKIKEASTSIMDEVLEQNEIIAGNTKKIKFLIESEGEIRTQIEKQGIKL